MDIFDQISIDKNKKEKPSGDIFDQLSSGPSIDERAKSLIQQNPVLGTAKLPMSFGQKVKTTVENLPDSAIGMAKGMYQIARHPLNTMDAYSSMLAGLALAGIPQQYRKPGTEEKAQTLETAARPVVEKAQAFVQHPVNEMAKFIIEDPIQAMLLMRGFLPKGQITPAVPIRANAIRQAGERTGIPTTLAEETGSPFWQKSETLLERLPGPFGIRKFRERQLTAADTAAKETLGKYIANPENPTFWGNKEFIDSVYQDVRDTASRINLKSGVEKTLSATQELLDRYPSIFESLQDTRTKKILKNIVSDTAEKAPLTFDDLWSLRKGLGISKENARAQGNIEAASVLGKVKNAVDADIDTLSSTSKSGITEKLAAANEAYKRYNVKFEMIQGAYEKAIGKVKSGGGISSEELKSFSPQKFSTALRSILDKETRVKKSGLFAPQEIDELSGTANIMSVVKRAGQFAENPPTGARWIDFLLGPGIGYEAGKTLFGQAGGEGALAGATGVAAYAGLMKFLTTTQIGKNLAFAASKISPTSPAMKMIMQQVYKNMPAILAAETTNKKQQLSDIARITYPNYPIVKPVAKAPAITTPVVTTTANQAREKQQEKKKKDYKRKGNIEDIE